MSADLRVVHMPGRMGGEATIGDTRIDCHTIAGRVWAGDTVADLAEDFGLTRDQVRLACWWMVEHCLPLDVRWVREAKNAWRAWAERWETLARNGDGDRAGDPTPREEQIGELAVIPEVLYGFDRQAETRRAPRTLASRG